jgi:hypothetical protein
MLGTSPAAAIVLNLLLNAASSFTEMSLILTPGLAFSKSAQKVCQVSVRASVPVHRVRVVMVTVLDPVAPPPPAHGRQRYQAANQDQNEKKTAIFVTFHLFFLQNGNICLYKKANLLWKYYVGFVKENLRKIIIL